MASLVLLAALAAGDASRESLGAGSFRAELLVDATAIAAGDVVVTKLRVVNHDRLTLPLWSESVTGSGYAKYEFRYEDEKWQQYRPFRDYTICSIRGTYSSFLQPKDCQSELLLWDRNDDRQSAFSRPGTYRLRARYQSVEGELITPEVQIKVSGSKAGDTVRRTDFPIQGPWEFCVEGPVNAQIADGIDRSNAKAILADAQRLADFMTTGRMDGQRASLAQFLKWIDKQNPVRRECLLIPMGHACVRKLDVEALREVVKRLPDRNSHQNELKASLGRLERLPR